jgi:protoheme IX farnesyltransferase
VKKYYQLAKPGIIYGNSITAAAGFFLASRDSISWPLFFSMLVGLGLVMGGACVFNNCLDKDIDEKMSRTKSRATVTNEISMRNAWIYGSVLLLLGSAILFFFTNILTLCVALIGAVVYVGMYTPLKRHTMYSTIIGAVAGATPPVVGFCAVTNTFNLEALLLFLILFFWQMPHFYAIAIYRQSEYEAAGIPLLPIQKGIPKTKIHILVYICIFILTAALLTFLHVTGYIYLGVISILGMIWLYLCITGFYPETNDIAWAKKMFLFSLIVITLWSAVAAIGARVP